MVAKELTETHDFTQIQTAEKLGTTQAAISQYIHSKRGYKGAEQFKDVLPMIQAAAREVAEGIAAGRTDTDEIASSFCKLCTSLRNEGRIHK